jgi:hypothetical protein
VREALATFVKELPADEDVGDRRWVREAFDRAAAARTNALTRTPRTG